MIIYVYIFARNIQQQLVPDPGFVEMGMGRLGWRRPRGVECGEGWNFALEIAHF